MIDKLDLRLTDYTVASGCSLQVQPPSFDAGTGVIGPSYPLLKIGRRVIHGARAFHNDENFNVTVAPVGPWDAGAIGCSVHFSPAKVANGNNYHPTDYAGTVAAIEAIERELWNLGLKTNLQVSRIRRLDTFRNVVAKEPYECYRPVLQQLRGARMTGHEFETGYRWDNKQWQLCAYDKLEEMQQRKVSVAGYPANTIRFEKRLMNSRKVEAAAGMKTVAELLAGYDTLEPDFRQSLKRSIFKKRHVMPALVLTPEEAEAGLLYFKNMGRRYWADDWIRAYALNQPVMRANLEVVRRAVTVVAGNRVTARRISGQIEQVHLDAAALSVLGPSRRTLSDLRNELEVKLIG
jgi:hypothetical protein